MDDSGNFGTTLSEILGAEIPIMSAIADQHAALYAQGCRGAGMAKLTNGTVLSWMSILANNVRLFQRVELIP